MCCDATNRIYPDTNFTNLTEVKVKKPNHLAFYFSLSFFHSFSLFSLSFSFPRFHSLSHCLSVFFSRFLTLSPENSCITSLFTPTTLFSLSLTISLSSPPGLSLTPSFSYSPSLFPSLKSLTWLLIFPFVHSVISSPHTLTYSLLFNFHR